MNLNLRQNQIILKGYDDGLQPGQQLVLEIWPPLKSSPVHNHGGTFAIIKMLSGELRSEWYNPIYNITAEPVHFYKYDNLKKGEITWMTPDFYQTHKLHNQNMKNSAISLQGYANMVCMDSQKCDDSNKEYFEYIIKGVGEMKKFYPTKDFDFTEIKSTLNNEYYNNTCYTKDKNP